MPPRGVWDTEDSLATTVRAGVLLAPGGRRLGMLLASWLHRKLQEEQ